MLSTSWPFCFTAVIIVGQIVDVDCSGHTDGSGIGGINQQNIKAPRQFEERPRHHYRRINNEEDGNTRRKISQEKDYYDPFSFEESVETLKTKIKTRETTTTTPSPSDVLMLDISELHKHPAFADLFRSPKPSSREKSLKTLRTSKPPVKALAKVTSPTPIVSKASEATTKVSVQTHGKVTLFETEKPTITEVTTINPIKIGLVLTNKPVMSKPPISRQGTTTSMVDMASASEIKLATLPTTDTVPGQVPPEAVTTMATTEESSKQAPVRGRGVARTTLQSQGAVTEKSRTVGTAISTYSAKAAPQSEIGKEEVDRSPENTAEDYSSNRKETSKTTLSWKYTHALSSASEPLSTRVVNNLVNSKHSAAEVLSVGGDADIAPDNLEDSFMELLDDTNEQSYESSDYSDIDGDISAALSELIVTTTTTVSTLKELEKPVPARSGKIFLPQSTLSLTTDSSKIFPKGASEDSAKYADESIFIDLADSDGDELY